MEQSEVTDLPKRKSLSLFALTSIVVLIILSLLAIKFLSTQTSTHVEFKEESTNSAYLASPTLKIDISGAVENPGVYTLSAESRIQDALVAAGGLSLAADRDWVAKYLNLAQKAIDGTKIYIPNKTEAKVTVSQGSTLGVATAGNELININTASSFELDSLPGVGEVTVQKIISGRPYQKTDELLTKKIVNKSTFEKIKDKISTY